MTLKEQWNKIADNWLLIAVAVAVLVFMNIGGVQNIAYSASDSMNRAMVDYESAEGGYYYGSDDFAPDVEERKITRTASMSTEVDRGSFQAEQEKLKNIISSTDSYLLNENVRKYGTERKAYYTGSYNIKVDTTKYDSIVAQLKEIGEVQSFNERTTDITGQYNNAEINLETEKSRLQRYNDMYDEAVSIEDKLNLNDRIFDQERRVKYLEDSINRMDQKVEYTSIQFSMTEKRSEYADVALVKMSSLVKDFVGSFNALLVFLFVIAPWAILVVIGAVVWRIVKR